jgi:predicted RNA-binding Zn-ribbon protein involved in translation (DUF1610 family)
VAVELGVLSLYGKIIGLARQAGSRNESTELLMLSNEFQCPDCGALVMPVLQKSVLAREESYTAECSSCDARSCLQVACMQTGDRSTGSTPGALRPWCAKTRAAEVLC